MYRDKITQFHSDINFLRSLPANNSECRWAALSGTQKHAERGSKAFPLKDDTIQFDAIVAFLEKISLFKEKMSRD